MTTSPIDLTPLQCLADLGGPETVVRQGWQTLVQVHGLDAVAWACVRCLSSARPGTRVSQEQTQRVLDGRGPHRPTAHRRRPGPCRTA